MCRRYLLHYTAIGYLTGPQTRISTCLIAGRLPEYGRPFDRIVLRHQPQHKCANISETIHI